MDRNDRQAIEALFDKLATVERRSPPRDAESEAFIRDKIARQPGAPYYMAQTIVVQEQALAAAEARLAELEAQAAQTPPANGGFFDSLFGDRRQPRSIGLVPRVGAPNRETMQPQQPGGGGFLAGAAQTALGVTGGVLLGNAIAGMLSGNEAKAAAPAADKGTEDKGAEEPQEDAHTEDADFDDGGADLGDFDLDL